MFSRIAIETERDNEPEEIRSMSKRELFKFLSILRILPDESARCSSREYLVRVYRRQAYWVSREELLVFESRLQPDELQKSAFFNVGLITDRLDKLIRCKGKTGFHFPEGTSPDDGYLVRVLRFEDPMNILGGFRRPVRHSQLPPILPARM